MVKRKLECIDAGSEYCPCYLAETNECITCSHLQGKEFCDCNWRGVCIYQEYVWSGYKSKGIRCTCRAALLEKKYLSPNTILFRLGVTRTLARELDNPGAYIFIRNEDKPSYFDVPMSVMAVNTEENEISVAMQVVGAKTKALESVREGLVIRGPYWNGILGQRYLKGMKDGNCLVIARGIGQAPAAKVVRYLCRGDNQVKIIADPGKVGTIFIKEFIGNAPCEIEELDLTSKQGLRIINKYLKNEKYDIVFSGGSDKQHLYIIQEIDKVQDKPYLVVTNNNEICCGEGVCGSCSTRIESGVRVKACKVQLDVRKAIERRILNG
ncbi:MAG: sulfide/dihydroorotate dehydrogenase-like FAD/NAD-binding protein [Bacillota bacterium]|nr:sulfide/dihydroorotate dehydrogenase-like FAD/NAD-binding protein [Bacillota bacterium]